MDIENGMLKSFLSHFGYCLKRVAGVHRMLELFEVVVIEGVCKLNGAKTS